MSRPEISRQLSEKLDQADAQKAEGGVIEGAEASVGAILSEWPSDNGIFAQLQRLSEFINQTKSEISALCPSEVNGEFIPSATDELDAIVEATAAASNKIMDGADILMDLVTHLPEEQAAQGMDAVTGIFEACTFQDVTGQRITKVVGLLKVIESRVSAMSDYTPHVVNTDDNAGGTADTAPISQSSQNDIDSLFNAPAGASESDASVSDEDLLNGPQLPGQGTSQADIDAMFD